MSRKKNEKLLEVSMVQEKESMTTEIEVEGFRQELDVIRVEIERARIEMKELELKKQELMATPARRELSEEEKTINDKLINVRSHNEGLRNKIEAQKAYDNMKVTGKFMNRRAPGNPVKLTYMKYADDPVKWYTFQDGAVYTIPRGFADQINDHYYRPKFIQKEGEMDPSNPSQIHSVDTSNKSYAFVPVNF